MSGQGSAGGPEVALAAAVLWLALNDLTGAPKGGGNRQEQEEARLFCFGTDRRWRQARTAWCDAAGVDPAAFERLAKGRLSA